MYNGISKSIAFLYAGLVGIGMLYMMSLSHEQPLIVDQSISITNTDDSLATDTGFFSQLDISEPSEFTGPLSDADHRSMVITFGMYITPTSSPLPQPEKWVGYHTALDLEILPGEEDREVPVSATCNGTVVIARYIYGYGGCIVQSCIIQGENVTVLYGHLSSKSFQVQPGESIIVHQPLGVLGKAYSTENGGVRKHLHLGIHKGDTIDYRGYVQTQEELNRFIDPLSLLQ